MKVVHQLDLWSPPAVPAEPPVSREPLPAATGEPPRIEVVCADCLAHMRTMSAHSVSVIVTSPPYNLGKKYSLHNDNMPEDQYPSGRSRIDRQAIGVHYVWADQPARFGHHRDKHCRGSAWHIPYKTTQSAADRYHHPATFPVELADLCLRLAAPEPDGLALDPFAGIGSMLLAAKALGLAAIGIEIDPNYCAAARQRLASHR